MKEPITVNEDQADIDMAQQEQDNEKNEVTIADIIEQLNKSASSKSNSSTQEDQQNDSKEDLQSEPKVTTQNTKPNMESTQGSEVETKNNLVINEDITEQSTRD